MRHFCGYGLTMDAEKSKPFSTCLLPYYLSDLIQPTKHQRHNPQKKERTDNLDFKKLLLHERQHQENEKTVYRLKENIAKDPCDKRLLSKIHKEL